MVSSVYENKSFSQRRQGRKDFVGAAPCGCPSLALSFRAEREIFFVSRKDAKGAKIKRK
jgi:hypothetical protein